MQDSLDGQWESAESREIDSILARLVVFMAIIAARASISRRVVTAALASQADVAITLFVIPDFAFL